jgi:UDP-N-acetylmuramoyl-tripeptide--D-alanyl-D-alanine ligase
MQIENNIDAFGIFTLVSHLLLTLTLGFYLILNMQWYSYKLERVIFKHKKYLWHLLYFLIPLFAYYTTGKYFWIYFYFGLLPALAIWYKKIDKKLVMTPRVKRFFLFLIFAVLVEDGLCLASASCHLYGIMLPLLFALLASALFEKILFLGFKKEAQKKLRNMQNLQIVAITASYGKTSIKNFLYQILSSHFKTYMTPRSVNTLGGLMKDVNDALPQNTEIYIAEAGARERGDIDEIARFLNHHYAIVGNIGPQHIEYFKTLENIRNTKMEILHSPALKKAFVHESACVKPNEQVELFGENIYNIQTSLEGLSFDLEIDGKKEHFEAPLLGAFNAVNITAAILMAKELGMDMKEIKSAVSKLQPVEHRLQKIEAGGKTIIDDSFNGNLEGMRASYDLVKTFPGRKILITPGVVESDEETNIALAEKIDTIFDTVIITGSINANILATHIHNAKKIILRDKSKLEEILAEETLPGDLILFSNDAPTFM